MKRIFILLAIFTSLLAPAGVLSGTATAVDIFDDVCSGNRRTTTVCHSVHSQQNNNDQNPIINIVRAAIGVISYIIGLAAIITLIVGGIRLMTANGDSGSVESARSAILTALVGVAVAALAQAIVLFVLTK